MAGRKAARKPAAPKTTDGQRRRSRVETTSDAPMDRSRMEEDLVKLITGEPNSFLRRAPCRI